MELMTDGKASMLSNADKLGYALGTEPIYWGWGRAENKLPFHSSCYNIEC
jgi:hypothetical protein